VRLWRIRARLLSFHITLVVGGNLFSAATCFFHLIYFLCLNRTGMIYLLEEDIHIVTVFAYVFLISVCKVWLRSFGYFPPQPFSVSICCLQVLLSARLVAYSDFLRGCHAISSSFNWTFCHSSVLNINFISHTNRKKARLRRRRNKQRYVTLMTEQGIPFSAFWLISSAVSVVTSLMSDIWNIGHWLTMLGAPHQTITKTW